MDCDLELGKSQNTTRLVQRTAWGGGAEDTTHGLGGYYLGLCGPL